MLRKLITHPQQVGLILLFGVVAGAVAHRYIGSRNRSAVQQDTRLIDWEQARLSALRVSQWERAPVAVREFRNEQYLRLVKKSEPLIAEYLGVDLPEPISHVHVQDRREWLEANFKSFEQLLEPIETLYAQAGSRGALALLVGAFNSKLVGAQMGVLLGYMARRVLGQYDLSLLSSDPDDRGALYFVEPNIGNVQRQLGLDDEDFRLWIALHETTHAFEFEAYPWVRLHFRDLLQRYMDRLMQQLEEPAAGLPSMMNRMFKSWGRGEHWIELVHTPEQRELFDQMQALMTIVEGYGNHVMNVVGKQLLPSFDQIEQRVAQRQSSKTIIEQLFNRITGMDLKLAQYRQGEDFINQVVALRGSAFAHRVWERPDHLPTLAEIKQPRAWVARIEQMDGSGS